MFVPTASPTYMFEYAIGVMILLWTVFSVVTNAKYPRLMVEVCQLCGSPFLGNIVYRLAEHALGTSAAGGCAEMTGVLSGIAFAFFAVLNISRITGCGVRVQEVAGAADRVVHAVPPSVRTED